MGNPITKEQAKEIVEAVLARHEIAINDESMTGEMAHYLSAASHGEDYFVANVRKHNERHERRCKRIELIESLLVSYRTEKDTYAESKAAMRPDDTALVEMNVRAPDLERTIADLESLQGTERELCEHFPLAPLPRKRPPKSNNVAAEKILLSLSSANALKQKGLNRWGACLLIADLLNEAGLAEESREKTRASLYNKLARTDLNQPQRRLEASVRNLRRLAGSRNDRSPIPRGAFILDPKER